MLRRLAGGAAAAGGGVLAAAAYADEDVRRALTIAGFGGLCRALLRGTNALTLHDAHHLHASLDRSRSTALISVSNHVATIDDPALLASIVPLRLLFDAERMRWGVCAHDVCFRPGSVLNCFADASKVPTRLYRTVGSATRPNLAAAPPPVSHTICS